MKNKLLLILILIIFQLLITKINIRIQNHVKNKVNNNINTKTEEINFNTVYFWNTTFLKNEMHKYSLYNTFKTPFLSLILINNNNLRLDELSTIQLLENLCLQKLINIEILLVVENYDDKNFNFIKRRLSKCDLEENNLLFFNDNGSPKEKIYNNLVNIIRGIYTIFINNFDILKMIQIKQLFNIVKGKIHNYFKVSIDNDLNTYLIRTKILKDLNDNGIKFNSIETTLNIVESQSIPHLNYISISLCPDNKYFKLAYVAMISILSSKSDNTYVCFYLIIPLNFEKKNYNFVESLYESYQYFNITYFRMDNRYDKAYTGNRITIQTYYRFSLGELLKNENKTIYIDSDIIVYKDLCNFYNLNFNGKMFLAYPTIGNRKRFIRINNGIILMNLYEMRKIKFEKAILEIIKRDKILKYHDQTILNNYFKLLIGIFPPEYHTRPWSNYKEMEIFNYKSGNMFDNDYLYFAHKYPTIRHFFGNYKPRNPNINHIEDWWFFARKSKYYNNESNRFENAFSF